MSQNSIPKQMHMCGVPTQHTKSTVTKHSDCFVQRTRQSTSRWLDALTIPVDNTRVNSCAFKKKKLGSSATQKNSRFETALCADLINSLMNQFGTNNLKSCLPQWSVWQSVVSVLQCVVVCCSVLQCLAVCCNVLICYCLFVCLFFPVG